MAANSSRARKKSRFSLLLLEEGEVLLSDLAVQYHFIPDRAAGSENHPLSSFPKRFVLRSANTAIPGRVKVGTHNLFFDSDDWRDPVIRIPLVSISEARPTRDNSRSRWSEESELSAEQPHEIDENNSVLVKGTNAVFQREDGTDHPYIEVQMSGKHIFTPLYTSAMELLDEINTLLHIRSTLSRRHGEQRLRELVQNRESRVPFDITLLQYGAREKAVMDAAASAIYTLSRAPGRFRITEYNLYFMPIHGEFSQAAERIPVASITAIRRLRHGCRDAALEVTFNSTEEATGRSMLSNLMISFEAKQFRERAYQTLVKIVKQDIQLFDRSELEMTLSQWRKGLLSNYDYLMYLNLASGRSFNDLSQYPVFPWVLQDYQSNELDLNDPDRFRNLSKPIGMLNSKRFVSFLNRYEEMPPPRFFYGTHYSTPAYTINYLIRAAPAAMLKLQNGRFDTPDRLFHSIRSTWEGVLTSQGDVKELIPEFYALDFSRRDSSGILSSASSPGQFLENVFGLDLGIRQDGKRVDDVELPPWAKSSAELFVRRNREALESDHVSNRLHEWIDLIFGVKSKNSDAFNVFYTDVALPCSLDDMSSMRPEEILQIETVYLEFGRTPERLFKHPHPPRFGDEQKRGSVTSEQQETKESKSLDSIFGKVSSDESSKREHVTQDQTKPATRDFKTQSLSSVKKLWGSNSRRQDSVLHGASDHVLASYIPQDPEAISDTDATVPQSSLSMMTTGGDRESVLDVTPIHNNSSKSELGVIEATEPILCTLWNDGYIKVYSEDKMLRSKHVEDVCSIASFPTRGVACGTLNGSIGLYSIDTGRFHEVQSAAHDAEIYALEYVRRFDVLISGSKDASLKIWRIERHSNRSASLRLIHELDAESCVVDVCGCHETSENTSHDGPEVLLIAALTADESILIWEVDLSRTDDGFLEPIWRNNGNQIVSSSADENLQCRRRMEWLYQGSKRRHALATVHPEEKCLRIWKLDHKDMAYAEVLISKRWCTVCYLL
ncbi:Protein FAN [Gracilariopsis chorda]|uniref:Protein FAN n=1 Tax=Gracilariopsis chorda TaxID=448386 RepID=A0A2V3IPS9_9FLOR|nr:Protein FAN [Gracilariopsis chorda]|eukprot:PXF44091.1 Protein FAN [Gracilariopsis chorda]